MTKGKRAVILHNQVAADSPKDELDVLVQAREVGRALAELGFQPVTVPFSLDVAKALRAIRRAEPLFVFNLVESVNGDGRLIHLAPALLDHLGLRYTGSGQEAMYTTSNKLLTKRLLQQAGVRTPEWLTAGRAPAPAGIGADGAGTYLLKSVWEHASNWLAEDSIVQAGSEALLRERLEAKGRDRFFAERYIEGREFNQAVLAGEMLPPSEIRFIGFPDDKLRLVDFRAKWEEDSFEYTHTLRGFDFAAGDGPVLGELREIARRCWDHFGLGGYARVDFRVDDAGRPWVLEINANPCLSPDSGFYAAAERSGLSYTRMVERIVDDCLSRGSAFSPAWRRNG